MQKDLDRMPMKAVHLHGITTIFNNDAETLFRDAQYSVYMYPTVICVETWQAV